MSSRREVAGQYDRLFADAEQALEGLVGAEAEEEQIARLPVEAIGPGSHQPRESFSEESLAALAASITEQGLLQPIIVRENPSAKAGEQQQYEIVAGERRWRAAKRVGLETVPCLVRELGDTQAQVIALIENLHRKDLNPVERGRALRGLKAALQMSWTQLAKRVGLSRRSVLRFAGLVDLPELIQEMFAAGGITEKHGRALRRFNDQPERQQAVAEAIQEYELTGDETISLRKRLQENPSQEISQAVEEMRAAQRSGRAAGAIMKSTVRFLQALRETNPQDIEPATRKELAKALENIEDMVVKFRGRLR